MRQTHFAFIIAVALCVGGLSGCEAKSVIESSAPEISAIPTMPAATVVPEETVTPSPAPAETDAPSETPPPTEPVRLSGEVLQDLAQTYSDRNPAQWGMEFEGIVSRFEPDGKQLALTLDACGGSGGSGIDMRIIDFLYTEQIPATLFVNGRWVEENKELLRILAEEPLFSIQNHGGQHKPLSVTPNEAYGIQGTGSIEGVAEEILSGEASIEELTGQRTRFFRSGTAHYDDVSVEIARDLGYHIAGFSVNGDGGATFTAEQVRETLLTCTSGDIIICHMNHPEAGTGDGLIQVLPELIAQGYEFVRLDDVIS